MEAKLDRLIQQISNNQLSQISYNTPCVGHHIIRRHNLLFKWDINNICFITTQEHFKIHNKLEYENNILTNKQILFKQQNNNKNIKDYLLQNNIEYKEFLEQQYNKLIKI